MLTINLDNNNNLTPESINILNAAVMTALPADTDFNPECIEWSVDDNKKIQGTTTTGQILVTPQFAVHSNGTMELTTINICGPIYDKPLSFRITPLNEMYVLSQTAKDTHKPRETHSQLSACTKLVQEIYKDDPEYDIDINNLPKVFFSMMDLDYYFSNLAITLEESILLWMESTGRLSVNMNDDGINIPLLLDKSIKRAFMFGPARNKVKIELHDGTQKDFSELNPSIQVELTREILSILPEI